MTSYMQQVLWSSQLLAWKDHIKKKRKMPLHERELRSLYYSYYSLKTAGPFRSCTPCAIKIFFFCRARRISCPATLTRKRLIAPTIGARYDDRRRICTHRRFRRIPSRKNPSPRHYRLCFRMRRYRNRIRSLCTWLLCTSEQMRRASHICI